MIQLETQKSGTFIDDVDPRVKLVYVIQLLILISITDNIIFLNFLFIVALITYLILNSINQFLTLVWSFKWYYLGFYLIGVVLSNSINQMEFVLITLKFLTLFLSFAVFSQTTSPDEITESLMKLGLPVSISWKIGTTLRQVYLIFDEIANIRQIHNKLNHNLGQIERISLMITSIYANSIQRSIHFTKVLQARGFEEPYRDIITITSNFKISDLAYLLLSTTPTIIYFIYSSQLYI